MTAKKILQKEGPEIFVKTLQEKSVFLLFNQSLSDDLISHIREQHRISAFSVDICRNSSKAVHFCFLCCDQKETLSY